MQTVYLIDDDPDLREYLQVIIQTLDVTVIPCASTADFFASYQNDDNTCILSDVLMPDMDGLEFQDELLKRKIAVPLVLMSSHGSINMVKTALKKGAIDFLEKPIDTKELLDVVKQSLIIADENRKSSVEHEHIHSRLKRLSDRESQILGHLVRGLENLEIATTLNISVRTVETHRSKILKKMGYPSLNKLLTNPLLLSFYA